MLSSKQRAFLRSLATNEAAIVMVGKDGLADNIVKQTDDALTARELVKGKVLETSPVDVGECARQLAGKTGAEVVHTIGRTFVLFRRNSKKPVITLPKARKKS